jgi:hypothetical protein
MTAPVTGQDSHDTSGLQEQYPQVLLLPEDDDDDDDDDDYDGEWGRRDPMRGPEVRRYDDHENGDDIYKPGVHDDKYGLG